MSASSELPEAPPRRASCPSCRAVFRGDFRRCSNDGTPLVLGGPDPLVGTVLAERYVIEDVIGDGGLGRVYRARHARMSRRFAIKVPFGDVGYDRKARARLANEAEAASRLDHPNLIGIVDVGETAEGLFYLAMELATGKSLADVLARGALAQREALEFLVQICAGLAHAHDRGLVHRDLKPENIVVSRTSDGHSLVQIIDFGLALLQDAEGSRLTTEGMVVGTPFYMAPEQSTDEPLDQRTDLFALGIILYEMLAGDLPFEGTPTSVARQNLAVDLPTVYERSGRAIEPLLDGLIGWLTRKRADDRPWSARVVGDVARYLLAGDRDAAAALLPESLRPPPLTADLRPPPLTGATAEVPADEAPVAAVGDGADLVATAAPPPPASAAASQDASTDRVTPMEDPVATHPLRRVALLALAALALGGLALAAVLRGTGGGDGEVAAVADAGPVITTMVIGDAGPGEAAVADAGAPSPPGPADVAVTPPVDASVEPVVRRPDRRDAGRPLLPAGASDAAVGVAVRPPVDAAPSLPPRTDAAVAPTAAPSLKARYAQVTEAYNQAVARHGAARTAAVRERLERLPPYSEAVRKPAVRAEAEAALRALARDLAAMGP